MKLLLLIVAAYAQVMELTNKISPKEALKDYEFAVVNFYDGSEESKAM